MLKHSLSIALIQKLIPMNLSEAQVMEIYSSYVIRHRSVAKYFIEQIRLLAGPILDHKDNSELASSSTEDLIFTNAVMSGFTRLLAEKLMLLEGKDLNNGGSIDRSDH